MWTGHAKCFCIANKLSSSQADRRTDRQTDWSCHCCCCTCWQRLWPLFTMGSFLRCAPACLFFGLLSLSLPSSFFLCHVHVMRFICVALNASCVRWDAQLFMRLPAYYRNSRRQFQAGSQAGIRTWEQTYRQSVEAKPWPSRSSNSQSSRSRHSLYHVSNAFVRICLGKWLATLAPPFLQLEGRAHAAAAACCPAAAVGG